MPERKRESLPGVSVVVPVYNTKDYLVSCVESLLGQTFSSIEIILVDDGSTDGSAEVCDDFAMQDSRVRVAHKKNEGVSKARNLGLDLAVGQYILFVDSDDWCSKGMIEKLMLPSDLVGMAVDRLTIAASRDVPANWCDRSGFEVIDSLTLLSRMFYQSGVHNGVAGKLYSTSAIGNKRFKKDITVGEDFLFNYEVLSSEPLQIAILNSGDYFYYQRQGSAMNSKFTLKSMDAVRVSERILKDVSDREGSLRKSAERRLFISLVRTMLLFQGTGLRREFRKEWNYLARYARKVAPGVVLDSRASRLDRIYGIIIMFTSPLVLVVVVGIKRRFGNG